MNYYPSLETFHGLLGYLKVKQKQSDYVVPRQNELSTECPFIPLQLVLQKSLKQTVGSFYAVILSWTAS